MHEIKGKGGKGRNPSTFKKIAMLFNVSESYVKSIMKIGMVNDTYFEQMDSNRISAFEAYNNCIREERIANGEESMPQLPKVNEPVFKSDTTGDTDVAVSATSLTENVDSSTEVQSPQALGHSGSVMKTAEVTINYDDSEFIIVNVKCICGRDEIIKVKRNSNEGGSKI